MAGKRRRATRDAASGPVLLSGGNPQIPKGEGDASVQAYLAALPGWKRDAGMRLDALIVRTVPDVRKMVKWNSPFYGTAGGADGQSWFLSFHAFANYLKIAFFRGTSLRPVPEVASRTEGTRYLHVFEDGDFDEAQFVEWIRQASRLPGVRL